MVTRKRDLRDRQTIWEAFSPQVFISNRTPAQRFYDVVIIGAGISGALTAAALAERPLSMLIIDRREPAAGSTSASTALIQWEIDVPLLRLAKLVGRTRAQASYKASYKAVQRLRRKVEAQNIDCAAIVRDTVLLAGTEMAADELQKETKLRTALGLPSRFVDGEQLQKTYGFHRDGAIVSRGSLELNPRALAFALLQQAQQAGAEMIFPADVTDMAATPSGVFLTLDGKTTIAAGKVIAATGYETLPQIPRDKYNLVSTWALATAPQPSEALWPTHALVWEASDPYLYFRTTSDNRIIVGGEDQGFNNPDKRSALIAAKTKKILKKLHPLLPHAHLKADYRWAGTFVESPTGLPVIGELAELPSVFAILGAGGNGITFSVIAAELATAWVQGKTHPQAQLFAPEA